MYYVYILQNVNESEDFYLGCTSDLKRRFKEHNSNVSRSTKNRQWQLVYYEAYVTLKAARSREHKLKHDGRAKRFLMERIKSSLE